MHFATKLVLINQDTAAHEQLLFERSRYVNAPLGACSTFRAMGIYNEREKVNAIDDRTQPTEFGHQLARESNNNDLAEERISSGTEESESYRKQQAVHDGSQDIVIRDDSEQQAIEVEVTKEARQPKEMTKIQLVNLW